MALIGVYADWEGLDGPERIGYFDMFLQRSTSRYLNISEETFNL